MSMDDAENPGRFNVNHNVCVRLTDHGRSVHRQNHRDLFAPYGDEPPYTPPKEESDGWSEWQMWVLMQEFGHKMGNGMKVPFEPPIFIGSLRQLREAQRSIEDVAAKDGE